MIKLLLLCLLATLVTMEADKPSDSSSTTHPTTIEKTGHKATKSHLSDSSPPTHTTTKKTATEKTDPKATKSHLSDSSPPTHTTTKKTATEKTDPKATKSHLSDSSPPTHTTTKKTATEKTDPKATKSHLSDSSPPTHTTTKKTATEKTDPKATKSHLSDSSPPTHTTTKKTATEKTDPKATKSHLSDSSPPTHTTTKKTATEKTDPKATKSHLSDSSPPTHTTTKKTATEKTDHKTTKKTIPQQVSLTCNCNGGLKCQDDHCSITAPNVFCVTTAEQNTLEKAKGQPRSALNQTCQENYDFCNTDITITLSEDVYWRSSTKCCNDSHNCNSASVKAPQPSTTTGNRVCPSCFALNATDCTPTDMNCVESETKCINVKGTVNNGTSTSRFVGRGCASDSVMKIKNDSTLVFGTNTYHFTSITADASQTLGSVPFIFLLSSFLGLLQAKFFY